MATIKVMFRTLDGEVLALFPEIPGTNNRGSCTGYAHMGQHFSADVHSIIKRSRPATDTEYAPLLREIEGIYEGGGDTLRIMSRMSKLDTLKREEALRGLGGLNGQER